MSTRITFEFIIQNKNKIYIPIRLCRPVIGWRNINYKYKVPALLNYYSTSINDAANIGIQADHRSDLDYVGN